MIREKSQPSLTVEMPEEAGEISCDKSRPSLTEKISAEKGAEPVNGESVKNVEGPGCINRALPDQFEVLGIEDIPNSLEEKVDFWKARCKEKQEYITQLEQCIASLRATCEDKTKHNKNLLRKEKNQPVDCMNSSGKREGRNNSAKDGENSKQGEETSFDESQTFPTKKKSVENEDVARKVLTLQVQLHDEVSKNDILQKYIGTLTEKLRNPEKQSNKSGLPNGVGDESNVAKQPTSSGAAQKCPFEGLNGEDYSYLMKKYVEMDEECVSLRPTCNVQAGRIKTLEDNINLLDNEINGVIVDWIEFTCETKTDGTQVVERKLQTGGDLTKDEDGMNRVVDGENSTQNGEDPARINPTLQDQLCDAMTKIGILEKYIGTLTEQIRKFQKRSNASALSKGVGGSNSSGTAKKRPSDQLNGLNNEYLIDFMQNYLDMQKQLNFLRAECERQREVIKTLEDKKQKLYEEKNKFVNYFIKLRAERMMETNLERNLGDDGSNGVKDGENSNPVRYHTVLSSTSFNSSR